MTEQTKSMVDVFHGRIVGVGHLLNHVVGGWKDSPDPYRTNEHLEIDYYPGDTTSHISAWRDRGRGAHHQALLEINNISAAGLADVEFGVETLLKSEVIQATEETVDNRHGSSDVSVKLRDLFAKEKSSETTSEQSAGASVTVGVTASAGFEGVGDFEVSMEAEAHTEFSESQTSGESSTRETEGEEEDTIPQGVRERFTETISKADTVQSASAKGQFAHGMRIGLWDHTGPNSRKFSRAVGFESWSQFVEVVNGHAPDNYPLAAYFHDHPIEDGDQWCLADLASKIEYECKFQGKFMREYRIETY